MARCTTAAATAESTPPDRPQMARPSASDLLADVRDRLVDDVDHGPGGTAAGGAQEVRQHLQALLGVHDLGVELHAVEAARRVLEGGYRGRRPSMP